MYCRCQQLLSVAMYIQHYFLRIVAELQNISTAVNKHHRSKHKLFPRY